MALPPLIEALLSRAQYGVGKINARGTATGAALQPYAANATGYFNTAAANEQAVGGAVAGSLTSQGQQLGQSITSQLQGIQAPGASVQQYGAGTATTGAQAGAAAGALSSADLQRLHSQGSAEQIYAAALPRLAALAADQDRRAFLADAAQQLQELSAQQAQTDVENQRYQAEQTRQAQQDKIERSRYRTAQKQRQKALVYQRKQDRIAAQARARRDADVHAAAMFEMGYKTDENRQAWARVNQGQQRVNLTGASQAETARHHAATEAQAAENAARAAAKDAASKGKGSGTTKLWDSTRDDVFRRAQSYGKSYNPKAYLPKNKGVDKATARQRLWSEFGTLLTSRGYGRKAVNALISNALAASGY